MEPLPLRIAHPKTYIVEKAVSLSSGLGARGDPWGVGPGGARGVQFSSASHGLNAIRNRFVLPLEAPQKGPFFRTPVSESQDPP